MCLLDRHKIKQLWMFRSEAPKHSQLWMFRSLASRSRIFLLQQLSLFFSLSINRSIIDQEINRSKTLEHEEHCSWPRICITKILSVQLPSTAVDILKNRECSSARARGHASIILFFNTAMLSHTGDRCDPIPDVQNAAANTTLAVRGSVVGYRCFEGFMPTQSLQSTMSIVCDGQQWTPPEIGACQCTLKTFTA